MEPEPELSLDDMLADPIVHLVMRRDGVDEAGVRALVRRVALRLRPAEPRSFVDWPTGIPDPGAETADARRLRALTTAIAAV
jgi:hypothetical protein